MKVEFTAQIKKQGTSKCVFIPRGQLDILRVDQGNVVKVTIEKIQ